jgi:hypothetical protein
VKGSDSEESFGPLPSDESSDDWALTDDDDDNLPKVIDVGGPTKMIRYVHHASDTNVLCTQTSVYIGTDKEAVGFACHLHGCRPGLRAVKSGRVPSVQHIRRWMRDGSKEPATPLGKARHMTAFNYLLV